MLFERPTSNRECIFVCFSWCGADADDGFLLFTIAFLKDWQTQDPMFVRTNQEFSSARIARRPTQFRERYLDLTAGLVAFDMSHYIDLLAIGALGSFGQVEWSLKRVFYVD